MKPLRLLSFFLFLAACSAPTRESRLTFRETLKPEEMKTHEYLGDVVTAEASEFDGDEDAARRQLRVYAARRGADFVVIDRQERHQCTLNPELNCVYLKGQAYRKLSDAEIAAASAQLAAADKLVSESAAPVQLPSKKSKSKKKRSVH